MSNQVEQYADLQEAPEGWDRLITNSGDDLIEVISTEVARRIDAITTRSCAKIINNVDAYYHVDPLHRGDLWWSTKRNTQAITIAVCERRLLTEYELGIRCEVASRACRLGVPLQSLLHAFRLGYIEMWEELQRVATELGNSYQVALLSNALTMWTTLDQVTAGLQNTYQAARSSREVQHRRRFLSFIERLRSLPDNEDEAQRLASRLGLNPEGWFLWAAGRGHIRTALDLDAVHQVDVPDASLFLLSGDHLDGNSERSLGAMLSEAGLRNVGVGISRIGLIGAYRSLRDAEQAQQAALALDRSTFMFRNDWLTALTVGIGERLFDPLEPLLNEITESSVATVQAWLNSGLRLASAAATLQVHPNTIRYRIEGMARLIDVDPRSYWGATQLYAAIVLHQSQQQRQLAQDHTGDV